jgi:lycopene cyclase CruP
VAWDVVICGGTLGILLGLALVQKGWRVILVEQGQLRGRDQEWNTSRQELQVFLSLSLLAPAELEIAIASEFNPVRVAFSGSPEIWVRDVLNLGVDPVYLLETLRQKFLAAGGTLLEQTRFLQVNVHAEGISVEVEGPGGLQTLNGRLLLDGMGHFSPIVAQARQGQSPDGICLVVGTCARGITAPANGDLMVSFTPIQHQCQYFWEAFPARDGRTTYLFTYTDPNQNLSLEQLFADYFDLMPGYQQVQLDQLDQLQIQRALFGFFPSYQQSPLQFKWSRLLAVGDSSGLQSPLSFGGFGAMLRHLPRLESGIDQALRQDCLTAKDLALLQPYQPNLSVTWLFQQAMSLRPNQTLAPNQINQLLGTVFQTMAALGEPVLLPFLQDVVQFRPLTQTLLQVGVKHPGLVAKIIGQVGPSALLNWLPHYLNLGLYSGLHALWGERTSPALIDFTAQQRLNAWRYGAGQDNHL